MHTTQRDCPHCDTTYEQFRTGYTYSDIYSMFWSGSDDPSTWVNKRRHTILGRWHEVKLKMWEDHLEFCQRQHDYEIDRATANLRGDFDQSSIYQVTAQTVAELSVPF